MVSDDEYPEAVAPAIPVPPGVVSGTGVIRDKDGNIKGTVTIRAEMTPEQFAKFTSGDLKHDHSRNSRP